MSTTDSALITNLLALSEESPKLVKSNIYPAPADPDILVRSWKMNEFKYYDVPSPFPTLARGLFTGDGNGEGEHMIIARGYDKFFNIGEVPWTTWDSLAKRTAAPYTLSLKSNGCIIFIAALSPTKLLITSKHSIGPVTGQSLSHAQAGEKWLLKYLKDKNKTEADLARVLWTERLTAIAELCDDSFEEHVLGYPPEKTGLHLHGLNRSQSAFLTLPQESVDAFAAEWGFIRTPSVTLDSIEDVRSFALRVGKSGKWEGEAVEGFVVRTHVIDPPEASATPSDASPYSAGSTFFFKIKFDEPYMMYRDWREATKVLLSAYDKLGLAGLTTSKVSKARMRRAETKVYVSWVIGEIKADREGKFGEYLKGRGIIATRDRFLEWLESDAGRREIALNAEQDEPPTVPKGRFGKTVILPVAVPGCGKTTIALALTRLFGFGHTQSDDIKQKKSAPIFIRNVVELLKDQDVVIADKNNHLRQHRADLRAALGHIQPPVRLLALNWCLSRLPPSTIHRICTDRICHRGTNHQTLTVDPSNHRAHEEVVWQFICNTEELLPADEEVDATIEMHIEDTLEDGLDRILDVICGSEGLLGLERPGEEAVASAIEYATNVEVKNKAQAKKNDETNEDAQAKKKGKDPRYYALLPEVDLRSVLEPVFASSSTSSTPDAKSFWEELKSKGRVSRRPHVTIVHSKCLPDETDLWERCAVLDRRSSTFDFELGSVLWDGRLMAMTIENLAVPSVAAESNTEDMRGAGQEVHEFVSTLPHAVRDGLHITVGTKDESVNPFEAKALVERWRKEGCRDGERAMKILGGDGKFVVGSGRVRGMFT